MPSGKKYLILYMILSTITCTKSLGRVIAAQSIKGHIREYLVYNVIQNLLCFCFCFGLACLFLVREGKSKYGVGGKVYVLARALFFVSTWNFKSHFAGGWPRNPGATRVLPPAIPVEQ